MHNVLEGTWNELSVHARSFGEKRLRLMIVEVDLDAVAHDTEEARLAAIRAGIGKFAQSGRTTMASTELRPGAATRRIEV